MKLYEIHQSIEALVNSGIDLETGEVIDPEFEHKMNELEITLEEKALNIGCLVRELKGDISIIDEEIARLKVLKNTRENKINSLKAYLEQNIQQGSKYKDHRVSLYWMTSKSVDVKIDPSYLPPQYQRIKIEPDKVQLKKELEDGKKIEGVVLTENKNLVIK